MICQGPSNFKITGQKSRRFWPKSGVAGLQLQFEFANGFEMMRKTWRSIEELSYSFSRLSLKFQDHTGHKSMIWIQFG